jgi:glycerol-3-phosphate dehydrogenase (NAD(P)+)
MAIVTILGAGRMGAAVTWPLLDNGHEVRLVGTHLDDDIIQSLRERCFHPGLKRRIPDGVQPYLLGELPRALEGADVIVSGVNSLGVRWAGRTLAPLLWPGAVILSLTKGVEADGDTLRIMPEVLAAELPDTLRHHVSINAVAGPVLAYELSGRRISATVFAGHDEAPLLALRDIFANDYYRVWCSTDLVGVETFAALKNAYVVGIGSARGMLEAAGGPDEIGAHMHNTAALLFAAAAKELAYLADMMRQMKNPGFRRVWAWDRPAISEASVANLQAAGDLYVTATGGRTFRLGWLLGTGLTYSQAREVMQEDTLEGAFAVLEMAKVLPVWQREGWVAESELPMLRAIIRALTEDAPLQLPWGDLMGVGRAFV